MRWLLRASLAKCSDAPPAMFSARRLSTRPPPHLQPFLTPLKSGNDTCMIVGQPFWKYPIAIGNKPGPVAPLIDAMRKLDSRPFRIVSHESEEGKVFNASFFEQRDQMDAFLSWCARAPPCAAGECASPAQQSCHRSCPPRSSS